MNAFEKMKSDQMMLETLNNEEQALDTGDEAKWGDKMLNLENNGMVGIGDSTARRCRLLQCEYSQESVPPLFLPVLIQWRLCPNCHACFERIGGHCIPRELPPLKRCQGKRGQDKKKRSGRRCKLCIKRGRRGAAATCKGRAGKAKCEYERR